MAGMPDRDLPADAASRIDDYVAALTDWRRATVSGLRTLIHRADPAITEDWKWATPVFSHGRPVCAIGTFKDHVKVNFFDGASLADPARLFNSGLDAKKSRAIDLREGEAMDEAAFVALVQEAATKPQS
jgi:hypothetical protein